MSLVQRLWFLLIAPVALCLVVYGVVGARFHRAELASEAEHEVRETGTLLGVALSALPRATEAAELRLLAERLTLDSRVLGAGFYDPDGQWLGGSSVATLAHEVLQANVMNSLRRRKDEQTTLTVAGHACLARIEVVAHGGDSPAGALFVLRDLDYIDQAVRAWVLQLAVVALALAALMGVIAWGLARALTEPVERFLEAVGRVAGGDLDVRVPKEGTGELAGLAQGFNELTQSLRETRGRLAEEEAARSALEAELHRAQMLAVAGQVAATLGHEIGSPLNVILGRARMTAERDDLDAELRDTFASIAAQCERITRVVSQFLSLTRKAPSTGEATADASHTAREVVAFLAHECRRRKVRAEVVAQEAVRVRCGHDRLFQVIFNLCMNALQAQDDGGRVRVRVSRITEAREGFDAKEMACIEVADSGAGVPEALRGKVFDPFFSTKHAVGGTGLGLAVVAGIVRDLDGRVTVDRGVDDDPDLKGAVFRVHLPLA